MKKQDDELFEEWKYDYVETKEECKCTLEIGEPEIEVSPEAVEELTNILSSKCL